MQTESREGRQDRGAAAHFSRENFPAWSCLEATGSSHQWRGVQGSTGKEAGLCTLRPDSSHKWALWFPEKPCP